jgi:hypothetical protein
MIRFAMLASSVIVAAATAQVPVIPGSTKDQLAGDLRGLMLKNLPNPLYEAAPNWGHQSEARHLRLRRMRDMDLEINHEPRNDGVWRRIRVEAINPADTLVFDIRNLTTIGDGRVAFQLFVAMDIKFQIVQQRWISGLKLLDAEARGSARVRLTLDCTAASRIEAPNLLPELVFELKVEKADLGYENLKLEHIAGIGGDAAQMIGETAHSLLNQWRPSIERDLLAKANAAIVKAGEQKEVRLSLSKLVKPAKN